MTREEIAKKLSEITGKPVEGFFKNEKVIAETKVQLHKEVKVESKPTLHVSKTGNNKGKSDNQDYKIEDYLKMFAGSRLSPNGSKIMGGRQMTRKEYNKFTKNLTYEANFEHPLHFKMFRAEGQTEAFYTRWCDRFPKENKDDNQEQE